MLGAHALKRPLQHDCMANGAELQLELGLLAGKLAVDRGGALPASSAAGAASPAAGRLRVDAPAAANHSDDAGGSICEPVTWDTVRAPIHTMQATFI